MQLADLFRRWRRVEMIDSVGGLDRGHVMRRGADAADALRQARHLFHRPPDAEFLKAAQFRDDEISVGDVAGVIEKDINAPVTFQAGDRVYADLVHRSPLLVVAADL